MAPDWATASGFASSSHDERHPMRSSVGPPRPAVVLDAVRLARSGQQAEAARRLTELAAGPDPLIAWTSTAAQLGWWWWAGENSHAAVLADQVVTRFGGVAETAELPGVDEFVVALAAAAYYDDVDPGPAVDRMLGALPESHRQHMLLVRLSALLRSEPAALLPAGIPEPGPMLAGPTVLAAKNPRRLSPRDAEVLYLAAVDNGRRDVVFGLLDAGVQVPPRSPALIGVAEMLAEAGRPAEAEPLLVESGRRWIPSFWWETLPWSIPLGPATRPLVTETLRRAHLERPVGEGPT